MKAKNRDIQRRIAYEAARILTELRSDDHLFAVQKAAYRLGVQDKRLFPNREEVALALNEQQRLFRGSEQRSTLDRFRQAALQAMKAMKRFKPLLVGAVYDGTADVNSRIRLHLFSDTAEQVLMVLADMNIPYQEKDRQVKFTDRDRQLTPCFSFTANDIPIDILVFPMKRLFSRPLNPLDNKPENGADLQQLEETLRRQHTLTTSSIP